MIIGFDAHVPFPVAKAIRELSSERQIRRAFAKGKRELPEVKIVSFYDYEPKQADRDYIAKSDVPWLERLVKEGGQGLVSGDTKMLKKPLELLALQRLGLKAVFFGEYWANWNFFQKTSLLLWHWPLIAESLVNGSPATFFQVPVEWRNREALKKLRPRNAKLSPANLQERLRDKKPRKPPSRKTVAGQAELPIVSPASKA